MSRNTTKVFEQGTLAAKVKEWQQNGATVVFTNGCFDLLHAGHVDYLEQAAAFGDHLIIGLNSDASVRRLKGNGRPVMQEEGRSRVLAALSCVSAVTLFDEETPEALIKSLGPDVLVKGADYEIKDIAGADAVLANGGRVETVPLLEGYSTSEIIERIKQDGP